jgi:heme/copper-type cytochrome/quinol oxidase subunit 2
MSVTIMTITIIIIIQYGIFIYFHINYHVAENRHLGNRSNSDFIASSTLNDLMCLGQSQNIISKFITAL